MAVTAELGSLRLASETASVRFIVSDNGISFDADQAAKIFEPVTRLASKKGFEGSGISLATVKKVVTSHGGTIQATGKLDEGRRLLSSWGHVQFVNPGGTPVTFDFHRA